jgi:hypothetical protein
MVKIIQLVDMELFLQKYWKDRENIKDQGWTKQKPWHLPFFKSVPGHLWDPKSLSHEKHPYPIQWIPSISTMTHGLVGDLYIFGGWDSVGSQSKDFFPSGTNFHQPPFIHDILIFNGNIWQQRDSLAIFFWCCGCCGAWHFSDSHQLTVGSRR